jgi:predicted metal-dependent hydrolase
LERAFLVEVRRSSKRRKTIEAYRKGDTIIVAIPARMSKREEERVVAEMVSKLGKDDLRLTSTELMARALELNSLYLGNKATPITVEWSSRMERIWGSCTIEERAIRLSNRLDDAPRYALDYILLHELVHLIVAGHGPDFKALLAGYPQLERAEGYLEGRQIRLEEDLVDAINLIEPINPIESMDPIESIDPIDPINPINPINPIDSIAKVAVEAVEQVAITALKGPRNSVTTKPRHNHEGQLELISIAEISA